MGANRVSEVSAEFGERVGGMVNGTDLKSESFAGPETCGAETHVHNELAKVRGFSESGRGEL